MTREECIEEMAKAFDAEDSAQRSEPSPWREDISGDNKEWREERIACMECALDAASRAGFVLVPREATLEMQTAAQMAFGEPDNQWREIWSAMLSAAEQSQ